MSRRTLGLPPKLLALFSAVALSACGGGGGGGGGSSGGGGSGSKETGLAAGVYDVNLEFPDGGTANLFGLVSDTGKLIFFQNLTALTSVDLQFSTQNTISGSGITVDLDVGSWVQYEGGVTGTVVPVESASLRVIADDSDNESVAQLTRDNASSNQSITLDQLSANYSMLVGGETTAFTVNDEGEITGSTTDGCTFFNGQITIPDPSINLFEVHYEADLCSDPDENGEFIGLGTFEPGSDRILFATTNEKAARIFVSD